MFGLITLLINSCFITRKILLKNVYNLLEFFFYISFLSYSTSCESPVQCFLYTINIGSIIYPGTNLKLNMEKGNPEVTNEVSISANVDFTYDASHPNEIKKEFPLSEQNLHDGFGYHALGSGTNLKLEMKDEVKPDLTSEVSLSAIVELKSENKIKKEFPLSESHSHGSIYNSGTNLKLKMDEENIEITSQQSLFAIVNSTSDASHPHEIKEEFSLSEPFLLGGFVKHASSAYAGTNLKLEMEEEVKPEVTSEVWLPAYVDPNTVTSRSGEIKKEFPHRESHSHGGLAEHAVVKHEDTRSMQSLDLKIKSEPNDLNCGIASDNDDIYVKCEPLVSEELHIKNETHSGKKSFKCNFCDWRSIQKDDLQKHMKIHTSEKPFTCNVCNYRSHWKSNLRGHMKIHTGDKPFTCNVCSYRCILKSNLQKHMHIHTGEKPFTCHVCDYSSVRKDTLRGHMKTHTGEKPYKCNVCDYRCTKNSALKNHMKTHNAEKPFQCNVCDYKCILKSTLQIHMTTHTGEKPYKCNVCDYTCILKGNLQTHINTHTGEKRFKCSECDHRSASKSNLQIHLKGHTGEKPFKCKLCDYRCIVNSALQTHLKTHTGEKPFKCNVCDYKCTEKSSLKRHMKTHTGEKPFTCNICCYRCIWKDDLKRHMKIHTGEKPFKCNVCDYTCIQKGNLQTHFKTHTGEKHFKCNV